MIKSIGIRCKGRVQGVFFRASTQQEAARLGLTGWVRNEADGSVLIHARGEENVLDKLIEWCHQGPPNARVTDVEVWAEQEERAGGSFEVKR